MRIGSLFTGYGGLDMAVQSVLGGEVAWYSEIDKHACTVLAAHYPGVPNLGDVTRIDWTTVEPVDVLTGGYPCQPFSHAGQRKGTDDERHLWPFIADALRSGVLRRGGVAVFENVDGHRSLGLADVLGDLACMGMSARWGVVRAADAGAPHGRKRIFIVVSPADADRPGGEARGDTGPNGQRIRVQPVGPADPTADADRDGHGIELHAGAMGSLEAGAEGQSSEWERPRPEPVPGGGQPPAQPDQPGADARLDVAARRGDTGGHAPQGADSAAPDSRGGSLAGAAATADGLPISAECSRVDWGTYAPAIRRWESITRPAPDPTIPGTNGRPRLSPYFVEWMMGLPEGHVTGHGLKPAACLKMLGNGVVPQQAALALRLLGVGA